MDEPQIGFVLVVVAVDDAVVTLVGMTMPVFMIYHVFAAQKLNWVLQLKN